MFRKLPIKTSLAPLENLKIVKNSTKLLTDPFTAGTESFFGHYLQLFDKSINVPNRSSNTGPMRNIYQTFQWTEPIDKSKCKCPNK